MTTRIFILMSLFFGQYTLAAVEDIRSMVKNGAEFDVTCSDGSTDFATAQMIRSNEVCLSRGSLVDALEACDDAFTSPEIEGRCFAAVQEYRMSKNQIKTCEDSFIGENSELQCILSSGKNSLTSDAIEACTAMFFGETSELQCLAFAKNMTVDRLTACKEGFLSEESELRCVEAAGLSGLNEPGIRFCIDHYSNEEDELRCIRGGNF